MKSNDIVTITVHIFLFFYTLRVLVYLNDNESLSLLMMVNLKMHQLDQANKPSQRALRMRRNEPLPSD